MKNPLLKIFIPLILALACATSLKAQNANQSDFQSANQTTKQWALQPAHNPEKESILVDYFTRDIEVPMAYVQIIRNHVIQTIMKRGRHFIIDAENFREMSPEVYTSNGRVIDNSQKRDQAINNCGARYAICLKIYNYKHHHSQTDKGPLYDSHFSIDITAFDFMQGTYLPPMSYDLKGSGKNLDYADEQALKSAQNNIWNYIQDYLTFETRILDICPPDKNGKQQELYIAAGSYLGVVYSDQFIIYREDYANDGTPIRKKLGKVTVREINGSDACKATMKKKDAPIIIEAFNRGSKLIAVSDGQSLF